VSNNSDDGTDFAAFGGTDTTVPDTGALNRQRPMLEAPTHRAGYRRPLCRFAPADVEQARLD